jgi:hypothetical protein
MFRKAQKSDRMLTLHLSPTEMNLNTKQENPQLQDLQVLEMLLLHGRWVHRRKKSIHQQGHREQRRPMQIGHQGPQKHACPALP